MGSDRYAVPGRAHRDLVAIYESRSRELALLLRQTVVPLAAEHDRWLVETRKVARAVRADLRASGFDGRVLILQWQSLASWDRKITGMLSVNGYTGQVWYHTWHGTFIASSEAAS